MNRLVVFDSVHHAIRAERILQEKGLAIELVPTPREISASCGQSVFFHEADLETVRRVLAQEKIFFRGVYSAQLDCRRYELLFQRKPE
jgi:hypothetical protein